jgi:P27 family predicted phage terminase small subunit
VGRESPEPSKRWLKTTRDAWVVLWDHNLTGAYEPTDLPALRRLFDLRDQRARFERAVASRPLVEGSQGQQVLNPLARQVSALDGEIRALEDRFGLTPAARLRLGITLGEAAKTLADLQRGLGDLEVDDGGQFDVG